jgi:hypothetical protein
VVPEKDGNQMDRSREKYYMESIRRGISHKLLKKDNWIGHISRRNSLQKHVIKGKIRGRIQVTGRRGRRRKQILSDLKEKSGSWN